MQTFEILVYGRVQGVLFRNFVEKYCYGKGIFGYVENLKDGNVKIVAQGDELGSFVGWLKTSPGFSKVNDVQFRVLDGAESYTSFRVVREKGFIWDKFDALINLFNRKGNKIPVHVAIIPDGNRRWAKNLGRIGSYGHEKAGEYNNIYALLDEAKKLGVKYFSMWAFSTDNWKRDRLEIDRIFEICSKIVEKSFEDAHKNKIRFRYIGRKDRIPKQLLNAIKKLEKETQGYSGFNVNLCLDYGGRDEIVRAVNKILKEKKKNVSEEDFKTYLDTKDIPDVDLIIRTSGEQRLSGFMPYQSVYSELIFVKKHFPEFKPKDLRAAVLEFGRRKRRFGG